MKQLYDQLSAKMSRATTNTYSTSFSLGIFFLNNKLRNSIYAIYGFVRIADEIVDSFEGYDQKRLLEKFREDTFDAIANGISTNPILHSFQEAVNIYNIDTTLIETFLDSMEMDLQKLIFTSEKYEKYILGSAEVVGLMCLQVFTEGNKEKYEELKPYAMKLGSAFQKVNFLRDLKEDYHILGRSYFPNVDLTNFSEVSKKNIEAEIEEEFTFALIGIKKLPSGARGGVYLAYIYYRSLFNKIKNLPPKHIFSRRIRINNRKKLGLMLNSLVSIKLNRI